MSFIGKGDEGRHQSFAQSSQGFDDQENITDNIQVKEEDKFESR